jgi:hypothetical protein
MTKKSGILQCSTQGTEQSSTDVTHAYELLASANQFGQRLLLKALCQPMHLTLLSLPIFQS